jgi:16S rRNA (cytidine1402-2'-O)-methyltransferase
VVCRELTKKFETIYRGTIEEVAEKIKNDKIKGEFVIIINK